MAAKKRQQAIYTNTNELKKEDPFLYYSQSKRRLDELRVGILAMDDDEPDVDERAERKTRFSSEVHLMHRDLLQALFEQL